MGAVSKLHKAGVFESPGSKKPEAPRMAGSVRPASPMDVGASSAGEEYRSVRDFRDFR